MLPNGIRHGGNFFYEYLTSQWRRLWRGYLRVYDEGDGATGLHVHPESPQQGVAAAAARVHRVEAERPIGCGATCLPVDRRRQRVAVETQLVDVVPPAVQPLESHALAVAALGGGAGRPHVGVRGGATRGRPARRRCAIGGAAVAAEARDARRVVGGADALARRRAWVEGEGRRQSGSRAAETAGDDDATHVARVEAGRAADAHRLAAEGRRGRGRGRGGRGDVAAALEPRERAVQRVPAAQHAGQDGGGEGRRTAGRTAGGVRQRHLTQL